MAHNDKADELAGRRAGSGPGEPGNMQGSQQAVPIQAPEQRGNKQSHADDGQSFVLVDSERGLDIGDDLYAIGEVRRADRLPHHQGGNAGQSRQSADDAPDTTGTTGV